MKQRILLGTYTRKSSQGIYEIYLDSGQEQLSAAKNIIKEDNPTYLAYHKQTKRIYSVTKEGDNGGVSAYQDSETPSFIQRLTQAGAPPCYVAVDEERDLVYAANYHQGQIYSYRILANGGLEKADMVQHEGSGPHPNQQSAHAHYADLTPDKRLVACDLGTDIVYTYDVNTDGKLTEVARYHAEPGTGPRHIIFHPNQKIAYLLGELASTLSVLSYDQQAGTFTHLQTVSMLPADFTGENGGAAIRITEDGQFVYTSNRGHNSIAVYQTSQNGEKVELIQHISTKGDFPRDFALDPSEKFVVAANQNSDNLTLYKRDQQTGKLDIIQENVAVPECVCVHFVK